MAADPQTAQLLADSLMLADLLRAQGWDTFLRIMEQVEKEATDALILANTSNSSEYTRGYIMGLRRAKALPQEIVRNAARARNANG